MATRVLKWSKEFSLELPVAEAVVIGDIVYINSTPAWAKADADASGKSRPWGVIVTPQATSGGYATATKFADIDGLAPDGSTPAAGNEVYLFTTAGGITKTLATVTANGVECVHVGFLLSATRCVFDFGAGPLKGQTAGTSIATFGVV